MVPTSEEFMTTKVLSEGGGLNLLIFINVMDQIMQIIKCKTNKMDIGYEKITPVSISECIFADNLRKMAKKKN